MMTFDPECDSCSRVLPDTQMCCPGCAARFPLQDRVSEIGFFSWRLLIWETSLLFPLFSQKICHLDHNFLLNECSKHRFLYRCRLVLCIIWITLHSLGKFLPRNPIQKLKVKYKWVKQGCCCRWSDWSAVFILGWNIRKAKVDFCLFHIITNYV